jgi:hypothetical protein
MKCTKNGKKKMVMFSEIEIKKDLMKSKNMANFSHYCAGNLYYNIVVMEELYQFPISIVDRVQYGTEETAYMDTYNLSSDLGTTNFNAEIRGSELARWITKAIKNETFIKVG